MNIEPQTADRVVSLLRNLSLENTGWRRFFCRWLISAEPLRGDAAHLLETILVEESVRSLAAIRSSVKLPSKDEVENMYGHDPKIP
jgi:hypothetical protein